MKHNILSASDLYIKNFLGKSSLSDVNINSPICNFVGHAY